MSEITGDTDALPRPRLHERPLVRRVGYVVGLLLLAAAVIMVIRQSGTVGDALARLGRPDPGLVALLFAALLANLVLSSLFVRTLLLRYGRIGLIEMHAVLATAVLLNYLPMRAGLWSRMAYHSAINGIRAVDTAKTVVQGLVISAAVMGVTALVVLAASATGLDLRITIGVPFVPVVACALVPAWRPWAIAAGLRYAEVLVWAVRYAVAFRLLGLPISAPAAIAYACASMIASLVPVLGNGLGLREWVIGLLAPILSEYPVELGVAAELVNRAAEVIVTLVFGLLGAAWLARQRRAAKTSAA